MKTKMFNTGDRVAHDDGSIGIVSNDCGTNDHQFTDVRWQTPDNVPSCSTSLCLNKSLVKVGENVVPMKRNAEFKRESDEFMNVLLNACDSLPKPPEDKQ